MKQIEVLNNAFLKIKNNITIHDKKVASNTPLGDTGRIYSISSINNCINGKSVNCEMSYDLLYFFKKRIANRGKKIKKIVN